MPRRDACAPTPPPSQRPSPESWSPLPLQWKRSEVLDAVHPVDDLIAVLRRVRLVESERPMGPAASVAYELALELQTSLHQMIRLLAPPSVRADYDEPPASS